MLYTAAVVIIAINQLSVDVTHWWGWDEAVYMSQVTPDTITLWFGPTRARGITWLIAPAMLFSASMIVTRFYLLLLSCTFLVLSFRSWRTSAGPVTAALAALVFSTFWSVSNYASAVFPNIWISIGLVGAIGSMTAILHSGWTRGRAAQLVGWTILATTMRPNDAVVAIGLAGVVVAWHYLRKGDGSGAWRLVGTAAIAGVVGIAPWTIESFVRFRNPIHRITSGLDIVNGEQSHRFVLIENIRATDDLGFTYGLTPDPMDPWVLLWWSAMAIGAIWSISRITRPEPENLTSPAAVAMVGIIAVYSFITPIDARYLLPAWGLGSICVAAMASTVFYSSEESNGFRDRWLRLAVAPLVLVIAAAPFQALNLDEQASQQVENSRLLASLADTATARLTSGECSFAIPWGIAQVTFATGCKGARLTDLESGQQPAGMPETSNMFVLAPVDDPAPGAFYEDWDAFPTSHEPWTMYYRSSR